MSTTPRQFLIRTSTRFCSSVVPRQKPFEIPQYIRRSPTDILKAIAGTISQDFNAPLYKYHDDPYLIPYSSMEKQRSALSKESGRKTARWFINTHSELFMKHTEAPTITKLMPRFSLQKDDKVTLEIFEHFLKTEQLEQCMKAYDLLMESNEGKSITEVFGDANVQSYLEMMCASNDEELIDTELHEEHLRDQPEFYLKPIKSWKSNGRAEKIFSSLENPSEKAYSAMIRGTCKFWDPERAFELYNLALEKEFKLDTQTFNSLIQVLPSKSNNFSSNWTDAREICKTMAEKGHRPNIFTMNSLFVLAATSREHLVAQNTCLGLINEFKQLNIHPSLGSYFWMIQCFYFKRGRMSTILVDIIEDIENRPEIFTLVDRRDSSFFYAAMECATKHLGSWTLAQRIHNIAMTGRNYRFMGAISKENIYFLNYLGCALNSVPIDEFFEIFDKYVPNMYTPTLYLMQEITKATLIMNRLDIIPRIWSDLISFSLFRNSALNGLVLEVARTLLEEHSECDDSLLNSIGNVAKDIWERASTIDRDPSKHEPLPIEQAVDCLTILMCAKDVTCIQSLFMQITENPIILEYPLDEEILLKCFQFSKKMEALSLTQVINGYANSIGINVTKLQEKSEEPKENLD